MSHWILTQCVNLNPQPGDIFFSCRTYGAYVGLMILYAMFLNFHSLLISCLIFNILGLAWKWYFFLLCCTQCKTSNQVTCFTDQCMEVEDDDLFTTSSYFAWSHCVWQHLWFMTLSETSVSACVCVTFTSVWIYPFWGVL